MIIVMGSMRVRPGDLARLRPVLGRQIAATRAEAGCDLYALSPDLHDPTLIQVGERWSTQAALGAHLVSDHMVQFNFALQTAKLVSARVDSYHPGGEVRKLIDFNGHNTKFAKENKAMVIVMGTARFAPGELDRLSAILRTQIEATRAENGCEHYAFARDVIDPDLMHVSERWRDNDAITAHFATPHIAAFNAELAAAKVLALSVKAYDENGVRTLMGE